MRAGSGGDAMRRVAIQKDGKIVLAGTCANARHTNFAVLRYLPDGSLDSTFGGDGIVTTRIGAGIAAW
ncbi:MAG: delta-60 repeat domain-containing protein [Candidatus Binatia bacterium]|nr:delta-60 repeat domain-containing protein [Candidatus Binatia bacterium]